MDFLSAVETKPRETVTGLSSSLFGRRRTFADLNKTEITFLSVGLISLIACSGLTVERLIYLSPPNCPHIPPGQNLTNATAADQKCGSEFTFALLILINCMFCLFHVVHGVIWERPYELFIFTASVAVVTCYCIVDFAVGLNEGLEPYPFAIKLSRLVILLSIGVLDMFLACRIAWEFLRAGRFACNVVQTYDEIVQKRCKIHFFTQSLLTFDLEFQVTMVVLILRNGFELNIKDEELGVLIGGLVFTLIWIICAYLSIRFENYALTWFVLLTSVLEPAYIIYKMIDSAGMLRSFNSDVMSTSLHYCVFIGGSLGLLIRLLTVVTLYVTKNSYGQGLDERIYGTPQFSFSTLKSDKTDGGATTDSKIH